MPRPTRQKWWAKRKVALQPQELPGELAVSADDLGDRDRGVVVADPGGHAAEELEGGDVAGLEGLGALPRIGDEEVGVRVGQRHHRQVGLAPHPGDLDGRLAEVELGVARRVAESGTKTSFECCLAWATAPWTWVIPPV